MRTRTRTDSAAGQRLDFSWDNDDSYESTSPVIPDNSKAVDNNSAPETPSASMPTDETSAQSAPPAPMQVDVQPASLDAAPSPESLKEEEQPDAANPVEQPPDSEQEAKPSAQTPAQDASQHPSLKKQKSKLPKQTQNTSIVNNEMSLGKLLKQFRESANVSIDDLHKRLSIQSSTIQDLEDGDYESLSHSFVDSNAIFLVATIKEICNELGVTKNQTDELVDLYYEEIAKTGLPLNETKTTPIPDRTGNDDEDSRFPIEDKEPIIKKLPKIRVFLLLMSIVVFIFVSLIMPYIKGARKPAEHELDFAPLIAPEKAPPIRLNVP
ncbi:MAG: helix-turn-helix domain-containing protein [Victivallales bacterium]|nr:helix-turn-helix domain-containing protein [Victivallales bacterium]